MNCKRQLTAWIVASAIALCSMSVQANNSQQDKMKSCNADASAKNLAGADRKAYMKSCLSAKPAAPASTATNSQQQKMKTCNADATARSLTGDARKAYMKTCLSATPSSSTAPAPAGAAPATK
jgi:hypothetical protein